LTLEKMQTFSNGRYDISAEASANIESDYVNQLNDAVEKLDALTIRKPSVPSARILQQARTSGGGSNPTSPTSSRMSGPGLGRSTSAVKSPPPYSSSGAGAAAAAATSAGVKRPPPPPPAKPKPGAAAAVQHVVALYDYTAQADGDLSFNAGDRIEVVEKTASAEDWWTGKINGQQGVFPG
jgi:amphiphysin